MESNKKIIIDSLSEAKLYESNDVIIKTDNDIPIGKGQIIVTSRKVMLHIFKEDICQYVDIILRYQDILFHAINITDNFVLLNIGIDSQYVLNKKLYIYSQEGNL